MRFPTRLTSSALAVACVGAVMAATGILRAADAYRAYDDLGTRATTRYRAAVELRKAADGTVYEASAFNRTAISKGDISTLARIKAAMFAELGEIERTAAFFRASTPNGDPVRVMLDEIMTLADDITSQTELIDGLLRIEATSPQFLPPAQQLFKSAGEIQSLANGTLAAEEQAIAERSEAQSALAAKNAVTDVILASCALLLALVLSRRSVQAVERPVREAEEIAAQFLSGKRHAWDISAVPDLMGTVVRAAKADIAALDRRLAERDEEISAMRRADAAAADAVTREGHDHAERIAELERSKSAMVGLLEDIDQEKRNASEARARTEAIIESMGDGVCVIDPAGAIVLSNHAAARMLGVKGALPGASWWAAASFATFDGKPVAPTDHPLKAALSSNTTVTQRLLLKKDADHDGLPVSIVSAPIEASGERIGGVAVIRDITEEHELDKAKDEFISIASHQLKTPLTTISWYAESIQDGDHGPLSKALREPVGVILDSSRRLVTLVNALLNASRVEMDRFSITPQPSNLKKIVQEVLQDMVHDDSAGPKVAVRVADDVPEVITDPNLTRIVYQNLIHNAIKYSPAGGTVTVDVRKEGPMTVTSIADTGMGIPMAQQGQVFKKMFRASNASESGIEGTGLGLYLVKAIVEKTGGTISFISEEGKGTTFTFTMPVRGVQKKQGDRTLTAT